MLTPEEIIQGIQNKKMLGFSAIKLDPVTIHGLNILEREIELLDTVPEYKFMNRPEYAEAKRLYIQFIQKEIFLRKLGVE